MRRFAQMWIEMIPPKGGDTISSSHSKVPSRADLVKAFQRLPYGGKPLDYTRRARAAQKQVLVMLQTLVSLLLCNKAKRHRQPTDTELKGPRLSIELGLP